MKALAEVVGVGDGQMLLGLSLTTKESVTVKFISFLDDS